jgi:hypothetical protein
MRTVLEHNVVKVWSFDDLEQSHDVLVDQTFVDLNFSFKHFQVGPSELFELNYFYGVTLVDVFDLDCFVDFARKTFAQLVIRGVLIDAHFGLVFLESVQLLQSLLLGEVSRHGLVFVVAAFDVSAKSSHSHCY